MPRLPHLFSSLGVLSIVSAQCALLSPTAARAQSPALGASPKLPVSSPQPPRGLIEPKPVPPTVPATPPATSVSSPSAIIEFDEGSPLGRVLRMLALEAGINYIEPTIDPAETVAFTLHGMTAKDAFYLVAKSRGFQIFDRDGALELVRSSAKTSDTLVTRSYAFKHVDARLAIVSVANLLGIDQIKPANRTSPAFPEPASSGMATTTSNGSGGGGSGGSSSFNASSSGAVSSTSSDGTGSGGGGGSGNGNMSSDGRFIPGLPMDTPLWKGGFDPKQKNYIYLDRITNALVVRTTEKQHEEVERYIRVLDVSEPQIEITARVIEIDVDKLHELGLDWSLGYSNRKGKLLNGTSFIDGDLRSRNVYREDTSGGSIGMPNTSRTILPGWQVDLLLKATQSRDRSSLVTDTRVVTRSGIPAVVNNIVQEFIETFSTAASATVNGSSATSPYSYSMQSGTQSFQTGVVLDVLPRVLEDGRIDLNINPTVLTRIGQTTGASGQKLPIIVRRSTTTSVMVRDGFTVGIGGLMQLGEQRGTKQVPILGNVPLLGPLLGSNSDSAKKRNLVILVTPRLIQEEQFLSAPTLPEAREAALEAGNQVINPRPWVAPKNRK
ncbi:MAG: hypothetical protein RLZZ244_1405 [Verrucomicrobiota bacterium]|jgi:general secretion pathway protein D